MKPYLQTCVIASGSKGNCIYVSDGETRILIDAGLSGKEILRRMDSKGLNGRQLDAIVVSHEHSDHIRSVGTLSRKFNLPVYISHDTWRACEAQLGTLSEKKHFECGNTFSVGGLSIHPFTLPHDAEDAAGFTITTDDAKLGIVTDLGMITNMIRERLRGVNMLIVEANHDPEMLADGPYPWHLKQRVKGRTGHLSNQAAKQLVMDILHDELRHVVLAHLSEINNTPEKTIAEIAPILRHSNTQLTIASQNCCGELLHL